ncbi:DNA-directed DNA polymerase [Ranunculus cassubicifolius]
MNYNNKFRRDSNDYRNPKKQRNNRTDEDDIREAKLGFDLFTEGDKKLGWLLTFASSSSKARDENTVYSCVDLYFVTQDGSYFKCKYKFRPYIYVATKV